MPQPLPDDELLDVPLGNLLPGELMRSFKVHAEHAHKDEEAEALQQTHRLERQTTDERKQDEEQELFRREEALLAHIAEREELLREEAQRLDDRAIKLHDGRRAYVDGGCYRDAEGRELTGADRAQAEVLHVDQPNAATWQEERDLKERYFALEKMKHDVGNLQAGKAGANEEVLLSKYEKQMQRRTDASRVPDYSDTDYMGALSGLTAHPQAKANPALNN